MMKISSDITNDQKVYFGTFLLVFVTSGLPMLLDADTYNTKMNRFGKLLGDAKGYDVDSMPWRLRYKLIQDVTAMSAGILATCFCLGSESSTTSSSSRATPLLWTLTVFDLGGAVTSGYVALKTKLKAEWVPTAVHGVIGIWGLTLCWKDHCRR